MEGVIATQMYKGLGERLSACKLINVNYYLDIDKAKEMLRWINSNISVIDTSDIL